MLSDLVKPRISELGKIKIGGLGEEKKAQGGGTYRLPVKLDHFVVTTMQRDEKKNLMIDTELMESLRSEGFADKDGKIRRLPVACLSNDPEEVMQTAWIAYEGKRLAAKSDGVELVKFYDFNQWKWLDEPVRCEWKEEYAELTVGQGNNARPMFKLHSTLNVVIASRAARWGGYYKLRTTSQISAAQLYGSMLFTKENLTFGLLRGVPLQLVVRPIQVNPDGKATTVFVVHLEARGDDMESIRTLALQRAELELKNSLQVAKAHRQYLALMRSPADFDEEEAAEIAQEFHPTPALEAAATPTQPPRASALGERMAAAMTPQTQTAPGPNATPTTPPVDDGINEPPAKQEGLFTERPGQAPLH